MAPIDLAKLPVILERDPDEQWVALIGIGDGFVEATRRYGSWTTFPDENTGRFREVDAAVSDALGQRVRMAVELQRRVGKLGG